MMIGGPDCHVRMRSWRSFDTCMAPTNHPAGTVDVVVTTPNGVGTLAHGYTFVPPYTAPAPIGRIGDGSGSGGISAPAPTSRNVGAP